jgi:hypothetical protein
MNVVEGEEEGSSEEYDAEIEVPGDEEEEEEDVVVVPK